MRAPHLRASGNAQRTSRILGAANLARGTRRCNVARRDYPKLESLRNRANAIVAAPISGAFVALVDTAATMVFGVSSDARGRFTLLVRQRGVYAVIATKDGYIDQESGWLSLEPRDTLEVITRMARRATNAPASAH